MRPERRKMREDKSLKITLKAAFLIILISSLMLLPAAASADASWDAEETLLTFLHDNYPWDEIEVRNIRVNGKPGEEAPEKISVEKGPLGKAVFSFYFKEEGRVLVMADVRAFGQVVRSKRPYSRGHVIIPENLYVSKMDIRKIPGSAIKDPASITGRSLKRSMTANIPIVENMLEISQVVKRGKRVVLVINSGGLNIMASGKTREKGYVGMPVRALNLSSKKEVMGVLVDENTVEVEL